MCSRYSVDSLKLCLAFTPHPHPCNCLHHPPPSVCASSHSHVTSWKCECTVLIQDWTCNGRRVSHDHKMYPMWFWSMWLKGSCDIAANKHCALTESLPVTTTACTANARTQRLCRAWPFAVGGLPCQVDPDNEREPQPAKKKLATVASGSRLTSLGDTPPSPLDNSPTGPSAQWESQSPGLSPPLNPRNGRTPTAWMNPTASTPTRLAYTMT